MKLEYETMYMYKVYYDDGKKLCTMMIETKEMAESIVAMLQAQGKSCGLNIYLWKTQIEK